MLKRSYIAKLFLILSIVLAIVAIIMSMSIYNYSKSAINSELIDLNKAILGQISENVSWTIADFMSLSNKIANDSSLMEFLRLDTISSEEEDNMEYLIEDMTNNYIWSGSRQKRLLKVYVIGFNGASYASSTPDLDISDLESSKYEDILKNNHGEVVVVNTSLNPEERGLYRHAFQVVKEIRDHITRKHYGYVILNISENALYGSYKDLIKDNRRAFIVDEDANILSSKDKRLIEEPYLDSTFSERTLTYSGHTIVENDTNTSMIFYNRIQGTEWYLVEEIDTDEILEPLGNIRKFILFITTICVFIFIILSKYFAQKISKPIVSIRNKMEQVTKGNLEVRAEIYKDDEFGQIANSFNKMVEQIDYLLDTVKIKEGNKRLAELDFLRAQVNPHFIYNTLSSIRFYIEMGKNKEAEEMLFYFSKILRNSLSRSDEFVTLQDELQTIKHYIQLQKLRYTDAFEVVYDVSEDILDAMVPTFILQPIVENSIFYSVAEKATGLIKIMGKKEDNNIKIIISDNGVGMNKQQIDNAFNKEVQINKVGLINVHERIQLNYGLKYGLNIISEEGEGTQVVFTLPYTKI